MAAGAERPRRWWRRAPPPGWVSGLQLASAGATRATFLELFFDLVYVFALTRVSARAFGDLAAKTSGWSSFTGTGKTLLLLLALWSVWQGTSWTASRYDPYHFGLQTVVVTALVASMVMGVAIPRAFAESGLAFAAAYVVAQVTRPLLLLVALGQHEYRRLKLRMLITYLFLGAFWLAGAFLPTNPRVVLWAAALAGEYLASRFGWPVPGLDRSVLNRWQVIGEHLAERYQQFFLVALGETVLVAGLAYSGDPSGLARTAAFGTTIVISVLVWRIYFQRAGQILPEAVARAAQPALIGRSVADTHLVMVIGLTVTAIGHELTIEHPSGQPAAAWIAMVVGGPVLFLIGRARFEYEVFGRVSPSRWIAALALLAAVPVLLRLATLVSAGAVAVALLAVAVADARRAWGRPPEQPAPPF
ncbi:low temperature requirement protein A [Micromonospora carbonacea]|uniref:Low temperature requirement protein LtrA n=1 Tax=Micromonospora carbonacea TaxID=47853 RepID=A0A1C4X2G5_9ACTN|nr:low temperature requirement protein A [Micromonospora carbonacea]SCF02321.1 Low temperature requirement protein LtrA [Micromonospora carbonacea]